MVVAEGWRPDQPEHGCRHRHEITPRRKLNIEALYGAIEGELAEAWKIKLEQDTRVKEWRAKAEGGDALCGCRHMV